MLACSCSVAVLSGHRPHEASEERESYHLSDETKDEPDPQIQLSDKTFHLLKRYDWECEPIFLNL